MRICIKEKDREVLIDMAPIDFERLLEAWKVIFPIIVAHIEKKGEKNAK